MRNSFGFLKDLGKVFTCKNVQQLFQNESSNSKNFDKGIVFDKDKKLFQKSLILKMLQQFSTPPKIKRCHELDVEEIYNNLKIDCPVLKGELHLSWLI